MSNRNVRSNRVLESFIWRAAVGVLVENVLLHQNQTLHQALDPQITAEEWSKEWRGRRDSNPRPLP